MRLRPRTQTSKTAILTHATVALVLSACSQQLATHSHNLRLALKDNQNSQRPQALHSACGQAHQANIGYRHVIWIWMENRSSHTIVNSPKTPYEQSLMASCGSASSYFAVARPSLPNYVAATSGTTAGITNDSPPAVNATNGPSIFGQLQKAHLQWRSYEESMPHNCSLSSDGLYAVKHNPAAYYLQIRRTCHSWDLPLGSGPQGALRSALHSGQLAPFSFVTPNLCNDTHGCPIAYGDSWLAKWVPRIEHSPAWQHTAVFITWDEGTNNQHVLCLVLAPGTKRGQKLTQRVTHYSLLHTTELLLGLAPINARVASSPTLLPLVEPHKING